MHTRHTRAHPCISSVHTHAHTHTPEAMDVDEAETKMDRGEDTLSFFGCKYLTTVYVCMCVDVGVCMYVCASVYACVKV